VLVVLVLGALELPVPEQAFLVPPVAALVPALLVPAWRPAAQRAALRRGVVLPLAVLPAVPVGLPHAALLKVAPVGLVLPVPELRAVWQSSVAAQFVVLQVLLAMVLRVANAGSQVAV